ncbi:hypothetical protein M0R45_016937 [Rubus argutus]|uniref:Uncharacterized protein n=1 Tax=Rubus argutus TaxID=59490 RepID=A0AAW1XUI5_RUBAR
MSVLNQLMPSSARIHQEPSTVFKSIPALSSSHAAAPPVRFTCYALLHRRRRSISTEPDEREVLPPNLEVTGSATVAATASHGIEVAVEFKPVEHPMEPLDNDTPIQCPLPEPSILNVRQFLASLKSLAS